MTLTSVEELTKNARRVLEEPFWIPELQTQSLYERLHDDHDGTMEGRISVFLLPDGDAVITTYGNDHRGPDLRFRTLGGGGLSPRTRNALMLLAWAIKLDNEENPQCTCPKECDCQNPPPEDWDGKEGTYQISDSCPVHNENPRPNPDCPIHK